MHLNILNEAQTNLLPTISRFKREYYLVCGTAIALQIGHCESIDFDIFIEKSLRKSEIFKKIQQDKHHVIHSYKDYNQQNLVINDVKLIFFQFPYKIESIKEIKGIIKMPDLLTLVAMKAFAFGRRAK